MVAVVDRMIVKGALVKFAGAETRLPKQVFLQAR
jgi:hypothetical protein